MRRSSDFIRSFCRSSIESKRGQTRVEPDGELDILTVAMASGTFSDEELIDQMMTFLAAGTLSYFIEPSVLIRGSMKLLS